VIIENGFKVSLIDFGCASGLDCKGLNGTLEYAAPMHMIGRHRDIYSLGVFLQVMVHARYGFGSQGAVFEEDGDRSVNELIEGMLSGDHDCEWILKHKWIRKYE
jgi:serine/threonine protein kinase